MTHSVIKAMQAAEEEADLNWATEDNITLAMAIALLDQLAVNITDEQVEAMSAATSRFSQPFESRAAITAYLAAVKKELEQGQ